jgi:hypothetical protein
MQRAHVEEAVHARFPACLENRSGQVDVGLPEGSSVARFIEDSDEINGGVAVREQPDQCRGVMDVCFHDFGGGQHQQIAVSLGTARRNADSPAI